ncbi:MAG: glycosyltransferase family 39 protein [Acidobacteriota bacterium]|nr:glycosyltransferase family 39 protein [Acidobacteriota bacterium]
MSLPVDGQTRYTRDVRELLRRHRIFFLLFAAAALGLRLLFFWKLRLIEGDSFIYGELAKNLLQHHTLGFSDGSRVTPSLIRLPGYPAFIALVWLFAGIEHYHAVLLTQIAVDLGTCFLIAALARDLVGERAARWAFALAALCPFFANAATTPLAETLAIFFTTLTFYCAARACAGQDDLRWWAGCGAAVAASIFLRPDGGVLLAALGAYFAVRLGRSRAVRGGMKRVFLAGVLVAAVALGPLVPWTVRNWRVFHVFQPVAPRYANDPSEFVTYGYFLWTKTWLIDYVSVEEFSWTVPGEEVDPDKLPTRACDSEEQCRRTRELFDDYNADDHQMSPELDARFAALARERISGHWFRQYAELPALRAADMWFRPRTELLPLDNHWWDYENDPHDSLIGIALGVLNLLYVGGAVMGAATRRVRLAGLMLTWVLFRTVLLGTLEGAESRYTLECFPVVIVFAAAWLGSARRTRQTDEPQPA